MTKAPGQTAYEVGNTELMASRFLGRYGETFAAYERKDLESLLQAAEAASAAKAVEPWEALARHVAAKGSSLDVLPAAPNGCVFLFCNDKQSTNAPPTEAARDLCIQLGLLPRESEK